MAFLRSYGAPIVLAVLVHGLVAATFFVAWKDPVDLHDVIKPQPVKATLIVLEKPKAKPAPPKSTPPPPPKKVEVKPTPQVAPPQPAKKPTPVPPKKDVAAEKARQQKAEDDKRKRLDALLASSLNELKKEEASAIDQSADSEMVQTFAQGIYQLIVANWSRPPSAKNGMQTKLMVELVPTGDVVGVTIIESSGNAAFDRSAELAVRKVGKFDVPKEPGDFERYFRKFPVVFNPEDLLR
jgi:colicin import membrane protein